MGITRETLVGSQEANEDVDQPQASCRKRHKNVEQGVHEAIFLGHFVLLLESD